jgi:hypothetical protein
MAYSVQVVVDSADPHAQADWWAQTLEWEVEPQDESFIRRMIEAGHATDADTVVHRGALVWRDGAAVRAPDGSAAAPRILFQRVPEGKTVKNRVHLDLRTGEDDLAAVRARLLEHGARAIGEGRQGPHAWVVMTDPEGNEFCV